MTDDTLPKHDIILAKVVDTIGITNVRIITSSFEGMFLAS